MGVFEDFIDRVNAETEVIKTIDVSNSFPCKGNWAESKKHLEDMATEIEHICKMIYVHPCCDNELYDAATEFYVKIKRKILNYDIGVYAKELSNSIAEKKSHSEH